VAAGGILAQHRYKKQGKKPLFTAHSFYIAGVSIRLLASINKCVIYLFVYVQDGCIGDRENTKNDMQNY
jgi:hypothetical protein